MHPYGWLSLAPPVIAVVLAIATRRILLSLLVGIFAGALLTSGGDVVRATIDFFETHLWETFIQPGKLRLFVFTMTMGATVGLLHAAGGMLGFVRLMTPLAGTRRSGQLTGWAMGLCVFFDDYANTLLLGGALRPVFDRLRISREKLAYLVDSTAAPVAGLALVSTWIAVELSYVQEGLDNLAADVPGATDASASGLFVACIPYRFYVIQALLFVPIVAWMGRDFGPMLQAERAARAKGDTADGPNGEGVEDLGEAVSGVASPTPTHWSNAVVPLGAMLATVLGLLVATGWANVGDSLPDDAGVFLTLREVFGAAASSLALQYGALTGLLVALAMVAWRKLLAPPQVRAALVRGVLTVLPAVAILWFAGAMSRMTSNKSVDGEPTRTAFEHADHRLYTGEYLSELLLGDGQSDGPGDTLRVALPSAVFLLSAVVAFCTGTSFGTMGLIVPLILPIAFSTAGADDPTSSPLLLASLGGVLAGAIFGDHCSPISDTTILSSQACACDAVAHVRTQLPYALLIATVCVLLGTLPIGLGVSVWLLLPVQTLALIGALYAIGRKP